jgi:hypothetical protein
MYLLGTFEVLAQTSANTYMFAAADTVCGGRDSVIDSHLLSIHVCRGIPARRVIFRSVDEQALMTFNAIDGSRWIQHKAIALAVQTQAHAEVFAKRPAASNQQPAAIAMDWTYNTNGRSYR